MSDKPPDALGHSHHPHPAGLWPTHRGRRIMRQRGQHTARRRTRLARRGWERSKAKRPDPIAGFLT